MIVFFFLFEWSWGDDHDTFYLWETKWSSTLLGYSFPVSLFGHRAVLSYLPHSFLGRIFHICYRLTAKKTMTWIPPMAFFHLVKSTPPFFKFRENKFPSFFIFCLHSHWRNSTRTSTFSSYFFFPISGCQMPFLIFFCLVKSSPHSLLVYRNIWGIFILFYITFPSYLLSSWHIEDSVSHLLCLVRGAPCVSIVYMERLRITFFFFITTLKKTKKTKNTIAWIP